METSSPVFEIENRIDLSDSNGVENINNEWGSELTGLVAANSDVIVRCPWLGGAEVTLSEAMYTYNYPPNLTAKDEPFLISIVEGLLANRVLGTEELEDEDDLRGEEEPDKEESFKTEKAAKKSNEEAYTQKEQKKVSSIDAQRQPKKESVEIKLLETSTTRAEKTAESKISDAAAVEGVAITNLVEKKPANSVQAEVRAETIVTSLDSPLYETSKLSNDPPEHQPLQTSDQSRSIETVLAIQPEVEFKISDYEILETDPARNDIVEASPSPSIPGLTMGSEVFSETEPVELSMEDLETGAILDTAVEWPEAKGEAVEDEPLNRAFDYQTDLDEFTDFGEEEVMHDGLEAASLEPESLYVFNMPAGETSEDALDEVEEEPILQLDDESSTSGQIEITSTEQPILNNLAIGEIEDILIQLADSIETSEPETTEVMNEILDRIIEVSAKLEMQNGEDTIDTIEAQEELEELFTGLLKTAGIDYTPEFIKSIASLTLRSHLANEIAQLRKETETDKPPQESGTHEIIKQLLVGLSTFKKSITHAPAIGRSAIWLYNFEYR